MLGLGAVGLATVALALDEANEWRNDMSGKAYAQTRVKFVRAALSNAGPVDTLVLGDSISEMTWLDGVCGKTFNASVGGARIGDVGKLAPFAIERTRPKLVVLQIGTNHFHSDPDLADFKRQYLALVRLLPGRKILVGVPISSAASNFVQSVANHIHAPYVAPVTGALTSGGAHPTPAGAAVYRQRLQHACLSEARPP